MPHNLYDRLDRIKAVEREYHAVRTSVERLKADVASGTAEARVGDLVSAEENLEGTYIIRIWAEFETAVRSYYGWLIGDPDHRIGTHDLINAVAGVRRGRAIAEDVRVAVHAVRDYRNLLVHARDESVSPVSLANARRNLNTYLCKLPPAWG